MNEATTQRPQPKGGWLRVLGTVFVCFAILGAAVAAVVVINQTEPTAQKSNSSRKSAALVDTVTAVRGAYSPRLVVLGTVTAARDIVLGPRVRGQVVEMSPRLVPGGMIRKGDLLLRIDPADFKNAVSISQSELAQAEASREIEQARQRLAEKELKMLEGSIDGTNRSLVLREPQIASIEAEVAAAKAAVERATLDLDRSSIHAPFDAQVLSCEVNIGSQVGPGDELGRLVGLEEYWIMAAVPVSSLRWVKFPEVEDRTVGSADASDASDADSDSDDETASSEDTDDEAASDTGGSNVILRNPDVWGPDIERHARVARMIGTLDAQSRLARVLIIVDDPLGLKTGVPPLILDSLIETEIEGRLIEDVVRLKRDLVRNQDTVWVMADGKLEIRETEIVFRDVEFAYIRKGVNDGDEVVATTLATVAEGIALRRTNDAVLKEADAENPDANKAAEEEKRPADGTSDAVTDEEKTDAAPAEQPALTEIPLEEPTTGRVDLDSTETESTDDDAVEAAE